MSASLLLTAKPSMLLKCWGMKVRKRRCQKYVQDGPGRKRSGHTPKCSGCSPGRAYSIHVPEEVSVKFKGTTRKLTRHRDYLFVLQQPERRRRRRRQSQVVPRPQTPPPARSTTTDLPADNQRSATLQDILLPPPHRRSSTCMYPHISAGEHRARKYRVRVSPEKHQGANPSSSASRGRTRPYVPHPACVVPGANRQEAFR